MSAPAGIGGRTPPAERWILHVSSAVLTVTGLALILFRQVLGPPADDPFAVASHPLEPHALAWHVVAAPVGVLALGLLARHHVVARLRQPSFRRSRRSGWLLAATALPMVFSGYLLQVSTSEAWRAAWLVLHLITGALWIAGWAGHAISARRPPRPAGGAS